MVTPRTAHKAEAEQTQMYGPTVTSELLAELEARAIEKEKAIKVLVDKAKSRVGKYGGQCVVFIQTLFGSYYTHPEFRGFAGNIKPNAAAPEVGSVILTREGYTAHAALIIEKTDTDIAVCDSNYSNPQDGRVRCGRRVKLDDKRIIGYFNFELQSN